MTNGKSIYLSHSIRVYDLFSQENLRPKSPFGSGKVDFVGVLRALKAKNFQGPLMVESCAGKTLPEVTQNARDNRLFLERVIEKL